MKGTPIERMMARVTPTPGPLEMSCWICSLSGNGHGYTSLSVHGRLVKAHRYSYEYFVGTIPDGLDLDHTCRNRACVNPDHLEPVTRRVNLLRGESPAWIAHRTNVCGRGHGGELVANGSKWRTCRICRNERAMRRYVPVALRAAS